MYTKEEQAAHRKLWVNALRSGEYKQCKRVLSNKTEYCCLGVLCEVAIKNGLEVKKVIGDHEIEYDEEHGSLPQSVAEWAGLKSRTGGLKKDAEYCETIGRNMDSLANLNDYGNRNFEQIADIIEENNLKLIGDEDESSSDVS